jgi:hypothetical protein
MSIAVVLAGLNTLRPMAPSMVLFGFAFLLVLLPRKWSSVAGSGIGLLAVLASLAAAVLFAGAKSPDRSDLLFDPLVKSMPWWMAAVIPTTIGCLQRSTSPNRGFAVAGILLTAGSVGFIAASKTLSVLLAASATALIGAATIPLASSTAGSVSAIETFRHAVRTMLGVLLIWVLFITGIALLLWADPRFELNTPTTSRNAATAIGSLLATIALFSLIGWAPLSSWMQGGSLGVHLATTTMLSVVGTVAYVKLARFVYVPSIAPIVWAWAMGSIFVNIVGLLTAGQLDRTVARQLGLLSSIAIAFLTFAEGDVRSPFSLSAMMVLVFVTIVGAGAAAALQACELSAGGALGNPDGIRSIAAKSSLYLWAGLPLSLGFWGLKLAFSSALVPGTGSGMRQATLLASVIGLLVGGFALLRGWNTLRTRPALPRMEEDCRWLVAAGLFASAIVAFAGLWPQPLAAWMQSALENLRVETTAAPLKS